MPYDAIFRIILAVLAVFLFLDRHIVNRRHPSRSRGKETDYLEACVIAAPSLWTLALLFYIAGAPWFGPTVALPVWLRSIGVAGMVASIPLSQWSYRVLGEHFSKKLELAEHHTLVCEGPYRFVRHPIYATLFLCAGSTCLITANCFVVATVVAVVIVFTLRMRKEEAMLCTRFGDEYRKWRRHTGSIIPGFGTMVALCLH